jgi:hypothetical protein
MVRFLGQSEIRETVAPRRGTARPISRWFSPPSREAPIGPFAPLGIGLGHDGGRAGALRNVGWPLPLDVIAMRRCRSIPYIWSSTLS